MKTHIWCLNLRTCNTKIRSKTKQRTEYLFGAHAFGRSEADVKGSTHTNIKLSSKTRETAVSDLRSVHYSDDLFLVCFFPPI